MTNVEPTIDRPLLFARDDFLFFSTGNLNAPLR